VAPCQKPSGSPYICSLHNGHFYGLLLIFYAALVNTSHGFIGYGMFYMPNGMAKKDVKTQYGFISGRSTSLQLLEVLDKWTEALDNGRLVDHLYI
jgi:hypothetical protein